MWMLTIHPPPSPILFWEIGFGVLNPSLGVLQMKALNFIFKVLMAVSGITLLVMLVNYIFDWVYQLIGLAGIAGIGAAASVGYVATLTKEEKAELDAQFGKVIKKEEVTK
jgi:hypothetical protein